MACPPDSQSVAALLGRQGISLPPARGEAVAKTAAVLDEAAADLAARLDFQADPYGFLTHLRLWTESK